MSRCLPSCRLLNRRLACRPLASRCPAWGQWGLRRCLMACRYRAAVWVKSGFRSRCRHACARGAMKRRLCASHRRRHRSLANRASHKAHRDRFLRLPAPAAPAGRAGVPASGRGRVSGYLAGNGKRQRQLGQIRLRALACGGRRRDGRLGQGGGGRRRNRAGRNGRQSHGNSCAERRWKTSGCKYAWKTLPA